MALPSTKVEIAFDSGYATPAASRTWTDVSAYVEGSQAIAISRGRQDEVSQIQPSTLTLTLNNRDGRFTPELATGAYYPNVKKGRPIRVTVTYNAVAYTRFTGYVNEWPVVWPDGTNADSNVVVTASSRMARLGVGATLRSVPEEEILLDSPLWYYPLNDSAGAVSAADAAGTQSAAATQVGTGAAVTFGNAGPLASAQTVATFAAGQYLQAPGGFLFDVSVAPISVVVAFATTATGTTMNLFGSIPTGGSLLFVDATGHLATSLAGGLTSSTTVNDGAWHVASVALTPVGPGGAGLVLDGVVVASGIDTGPGPSRDIGKGFIGSIANVAVVPTISLTRLTTYADAILNGLSGESASARLTRLAGYGRIASTELSFGTSVSTIGAQDTAGATPVELMQKVVATESGVLFDGKDGLLDFFGRGARYNAASSFTLDATAQQVEADVAPAYNDQFLVNDVTATATTGASARVFDSTSVGEYGYYRQSLDLETDSVDDALAVAQWRVGLGKDPHVRYSTVTVDVVNSPTTLAAAVMNADIGTRFGIINLPSQAPATSVDLFAEGYTESITSSTHALTFNTSPTTGYTGAVGVWQLDVNNIDGPYILAL